MKKQTGITLVALVITIIVLLILAGVAISLVLGDNGILNRAKTSGEEYTKASIKEEIELGIADIVAELASKNPTERLTNDAIINNLPDRMQEPLTVENNLTGEYKGYEYWIDGNYVVHIGQQNNTILESNITVKKVVKSIWEGQDFNIKELFNIQGKVNPVYEIVGQKDLTTKNLTQGKYIINCADIENKLEASVEFYVVGKNTEFSVTKSYQTYVAPQDGSYTIELWGASGGTSLENGVYHYAQGGKGAYVKGKIALKEGEILYVYVGEKGEDSTYHDVAGGYNGGGVGTYDHNDDDGAGGGGGATDIRLVKGEWNDFESLKSRIMVAGAGGGRSWSYNVGNGGGLQAMANNSYIIPATQTNGYAFGKGEDGVGVADSAGVGGGGSGYYGGQTKNVYGYPSGSGGTSFISGYDGCDAILEESTQSNIVHSGQSIHYSGYQFTNGIMIAGDGDIPIITEPKVRTGDGYARIVYQ